MAAATPLVWNDDHRQHVPDAELWIGVRTPAIEVAARADAIRTALADAGHPVVDAGRSPTSTLLAVHDPALVEFLAGAGTSGRRPGCPRTRRRDRVLPYIFAHRGLTGAPGESRRDLGADGLTSRSTR